VIGSPATVSLCVRGALDSFPQSLSGTWLSSLPSVSLACARSPVSFPLTRRELAGLASAGAVPLGSPAESPSCRSSVLLRCPVAGFPSSTCLLRSRWSTRLQCWLCCYFNFLRCLYCMIIVNYCREKPIYLLSHRIKRLEVLWFKSLFRCGFLNASI
jgi:hypothetical protein